MVCGSGADVDVGCEAGVCVIDGCGGGTLSERSSRWRMTAVLAGLSWVAAVNRAYGDSYS